MDVNFFMNNDIKSFEAHIAKISETQKSSEALKAQETQNSNYVANKDETNLQEKANKIDIAKANDEYAQLMNGFEMLTSQNSQDLTSQNGGNQDGASTQIQGEMQEHLKMEMNSIKNEFSAIQGAMIKNPFGK